MQHAKKLRTCLSCGDSFSLPDNASEFTKEWMYSYCDSECWHESIIGKVCLSVGKKLAETFKPHELSIIRSAMTDEKDYAVMIVEGMDDT